MYDVENKLSQYGKTVPVNEELKHELRRKFSAKRRRRGSGWLYIGTVAAALAVMIGTLTLFELDGSHQQIARAEKLDVSAQYSFIDLTTGQHGAPTVSGEQLYLPLYGKGIYLLDSTAVRSGEGLIQIVENPGVVSIALSYAGDKLAFVTHQGIYIYDLTSETTEVLVEGNDYDIYYEEPSWTPDDKTLLVTKRTVTWKEHGFDVKSEEIMEVPMDDDQIIKVTDGTYASMSPDKTYIVFSRGGEVYTKALTSPSLLPWKGPKKGQEKALGKGQYPVISPDGLYIAYVREDSTVRELSTQATVRETVSNVYVANALNFADERKLTANYPLHWTYEAEWAQGIKGEETLEFNGFYSYFTPVWGSDSQHVFVIKNGEGLSRLMRVDLSESQDTSATGFSEKTMISMVTQYLEALVNRDTDTAKRIYPATSTTTLSNPHPIGFSITGRGTVDGREYVDGKQFVGYESEPYYQIRELRFFFKVGLSGTVIEDILELGQVEVLARGTSVIYNNSVVLTVDEKARLGPLVLDTTENVLYYTVEIGDNTKIRSFNLDTKQLNHVFALTGKVSSLSINERRTTEEGFLAINYGSDHGQRGMLFSLAWKMPVQTLGRANRIFFAGSKLLCYTENSGEMVRWEYDPISGTSTIWP